MHCSKLLLLQQANILHDIVAAMLSGYNAFKLYTAKLPQEGSTRVSCEAAYIYIDGFEYQQDLHKYLYK